MTFAVGLEMPSTLRFSLCLTAVAHDPNRNLLLGIDRGKLFEREDALPVVPCVDRICLHEAGLRGRFAKRTAVHRYRVILLADNLAGLF